MYGSINFPTKTRREREDQGTIVFGMEVRAVSRLICGNFTLWNYYIWILWFKKGEGVLFIVLDPLFQIRACQHKTYNCLSNSRYEKLWNYICTCLIEVLQEIYYIFIIIKIQIKLVNEYFTEQYRLINLWKLRIAILIKISIKRNKINFTTK